MSMVLYEHPPSSHAHKVKVALREKRVAFKLELPKSFGTGRADRPTRIFESTVIMECVEDRWPDPSLLPRDPGARAAARITEDVCDIHCEAVWGFGEVLWLRRASGLPGDVLRAQAARHTAVLQDWLGARLGDAAWFGGAAFGWADPAAAPMRRPGPPA